MGGAIHAAGCVRRAQVGIRPAVASITPVWDSHVAGMRPRRHRKDYTDRHLWDYTIGTFRLQTKAPRGPILSAMSHKLQPFRCPATRKESA